MGSMGNMRSQFRDLQRQMAEQQEKIAVMAGLAETMEGEKAILESFEAASAEVSDMIREYMSANTDNISYGGTMIWPLPSPWTKDWVTSEYGNRWHPISQKWSFHTGIDVGADGGTPIYAAADGKIISRGWIGGYGETIIIDHGDGSKTLYAHMSSRSVSAGQTVYQGQAIGVTGSTGNSSGPHLHFEIIINGSNVDPLGYLP